MAAEIARRVLKFVTRHVWSLSLSTLSVISFSRLAIEVAEGELAPLDRAAASWFESGRGTWDRSMLALTQFGAFWSLTLCCCAGALGLALLRKWREMAYVLTCGGGAALLCSALKLAFQRARPEQTSQYLLPAPQSFSFPSGHAMGSIAVVGSFLIVVYALRAPLVLRILLTLLALSVVFGVAASRVYFGVHYLSDVAGGQLAGAAWVAAVTGWFYPRLLPAEAAAPADGVVTP